MKTEYRRWSRISLGLLIPLLILFAIVAFFFGNNGIVIIWTTFITLTLGGILIGASITLGLINKEIDRENKK
jgi:ABC-type multidrug transport system permease subunit